MGKTAKVHESDSQPIPEKSGWSALATITTFDRGKIHSQKWRKEGAVVPKRVAAFTPSSVFVESLLEQLCKVFEKDPPSQKKLYELICQKLYAMKLIDKTYKVEEFQFMRNYYQQALFRLLSVSNSPAIDSKIESFLNQSPSHLSLPPPISSGIFDRSRYEDEFEELGYIARGGFGRVYRVRNKIDGCEYAVKKICLRYQGGDQFIRALREVRTLAKLDHPNIVAYKAAWFEPVNDLVTGEDWSSSSGSKITPDSDEVPESSISQRESREELEDESGDIVFANANEGASGLVLSPNSNSNPWKEAGQFPHVGDHQMRTKEVKMVNVPENHGSLCDHSSGSSNKGCRGWKVPGTGCGVGWAVLHIQMQLCKESLRKWLDFRNEAVQPAREREAGTLLHAEGVATALNIFLGILDGVEYMHDMDVVHHDLKPSNIFVEGYEYVASSSVDTEDIPVEGSSRGGRYRCQVRVGDFGLACHLANPPSTIIDNGMQVPGEDGKEVAAMAVVPKDNVWGGGSCLVQRGGAALGGDEDAREVIGTRLYAAPEQLDGRCNLKSDMYSLAIILFELLHPFFTAMERGKVIAAMRSCGNVPEEFQQSHPALALLIKEMLSENPSNRPPVRKIREVVLLVLPGYGCGVIRNRNDSISSDDDMSVKEYVVRSRSRNSSFTQTYECRECGENKFQVLDEFYFEENQIEVGSCSNCECSAIREQQCETINRLKAENQEKDKLIEELRIKIMKLESSSMNSI